VVNGLSNPEIPLNPGEVVRIRIVNENTSHTASFSVFFPAGTKVWDIARDGVQYSPLNYDTLVTDDSLYMAPGNRLDVYLRAPGTPGEYDLSARSPNQGLRGSNRRLRQGGELVRPDTDDVEVTPLARVVVRRAAPGAMYATQLPPELPPLPSFLANIGTPAQTATVVFIDAGSQGKTHQNPTQFWLGNAQNRYQKYNPNQVFVPTSAGGDSLPMVLGDSQTWKVMNYGISFNHPFHIHINPFQVMEVSHPKPSDGFGAYYDSLNAAAQRGAPIWMDVVPLPLPRLDTLSTSPLRVDTVPGYVVIRQRYEDFTGEYVMHCHVLGHEERGMMQLLEVVGKGQPPRADQRVRGLRRHH
jgi:FtsP/CotA-like multicopper oxidase with cupredoxin domain